MIIRSFTTAIRTFLSSKAVSYLQRTLILVTVSAIGFYILLTNNLFILPGQVQWVSHPNVFFYVFIPLFLFLSSLSSLVFRNKINIYILTIVVVLIDSTWHLSEIVNFHYTLFTYDKPAIIQGASSGVTVVERGVKNHYFIILIEVCVLLAAYISLNKLILKNKD